LTWLAWLLPLSCGAPEPAEPAELPELPAEQAQTESPAVVVERPERVAVRHVLIPFDGAEQAPIHTSRTRTEALRRAEQVLGRLHAGEDFAALAEEFSEDASNRRGGFLGSGEAGTWVPAFEDAAFTLPVGGVSQVVETPFGFHIIRREPLEEVRLRHLVVQYQGARLGDADKPAGQRPREEARQLAQDALTALDAGEPFDAVAARLSDGPMGIRGADLGWFLRGELGPAFDEAAFSLAVGEWSGVVETVFGYHVVERVE